MTKTGNILKVAFRALSRNKLRSLLTALGIIIGVACVVATIGIGEGARLQAENQLKSLGTNFLMIFPGTTTSSGARTGWGGSSRLSGDDVEALKREVSTVSYVSATIRTVAQVVYGNQNWSTSIQGGEVDWPLIRSWNLSNGQFFTDQDNRSASKVCVLGQTVETNLFGDEDPIGKTIRIKNICSYFRGWPRALTVSSPGSRARSSTPVVGDPAAAGRALRARFRFACIGWRIQRPQGRRTAGNRGAVVVLAPLCRALRRAAQSPVRVDRRLHRETRAGFLRDLGWCSSSGDGR